MFGITSFMGGIVGGPIAGVLILTAGKYAYNRYRTMTPAEKNKLYRDITNCYLCRVIKSFVGLFITLETEDDAIMNDIIIRTEERLERLTRDLNEAKAIVEKIAKEIKIQKLNLKQTTNEHKNVEKTATSSKKDIIDKKIKILKKDIEDQKDALKYAEEAAKSLQKEIDNTHNKLVALKSGNYIDEENQSNELIMDNQEEIKSEEKIEENKSAKNITSHKVIYFITNHSGQKSYFELNEKDLAKNHFDQIMQRNEIYHQEHIGREVAAAQDIEEKGNNPNNWWAYAFQSD